MCTVCLVREHSGLERLEGFLEEGGLVPANLPAALLPPGLCWSALSCLSRCRFASAGLLTPPGRPLPLSCASMTLPATRHPAPRPALSLLPTWSVLGHICLRGFSGNPITVLGWASLALDVFSGPLGPAIPQLHVQVFSAERSAHVLRVGFTPGGIIFLAP